jgi:hypothetical protein
MRPETWGDDDQEMDLDQIMDDEENEKEIELEHHLNTNVHSQPIVS